MEEQKGVGYKIGYFIGSVFTVVTGLALDILYGLCLGYGLCWGYKLFTIYHGGF